MRQLIAARPRRGAAARNPRGSRRGGPHACGQKFTFCGIKLGGHARTVDSTCRSRRIGVRSGLGSAGRQGSGARIARPYRRHRSRAWRSRRCAATHGDTWVVGLYRICPRFRPGSRRARDQRKPGQSVRGPQPVSQTGNLPISSPAISSRGSLARWRCSITRSVSADFGVLTAPEISFRPCRARLAFEPTGRVPAATTVLSGEVGARPGGTVEGDFAAYAGG